MSDAKSRRQFARDGSSSSTVSFDVTKDGKRFLVNQYLKPDHVVPLTIVEHSLVDFPK